jgi:hypothetical protein
MFKRNGFNKESNTVKYPLVLNLQHFAEGDPPQDPPAPQDPPVDPPVNTPAPITIDQVISFLGNASADTLFKIPAVKRLVENARTEEKDKLYKTVESKDAKIRKLEEDLVVATNLLKDKENNNLSEQEVLQRHVAALETQIKTLTDSIEAERSAAAEEKRKATFEAYKQTRLRELAEAGTEYLPDLLSGNTEEEFDASITKATARYAEIKAQLLKDTKPNTPPKPSTPSVTNPSASNTKSLTMEDIKRMSPAEYAKHREKVLAEAKKGNLD